MSGFAVLPSRRGAFLASASIVALGVSVSCQSAGAAAGYELDTVKPSISTSAEVPRGVAIDQSTQMLYVTEVSTEQSAGASGQIEQFDSSGVATANSPFGTGGTDYFVGVAVNPVSHGIYAYQVRLNTPKGEVGTAVMNTFSSAGVLGTSFTPEKSTAPQLATDATGRVYLPNTTAHSIQVFNSSGTLEESIFCTSCPGGSFVEPTSVATDTAGNVYAVDLSGSRVIKFKLSGGIHVYDSTLQSGKGAAAVGTDPVDNTVFVGDLGSKYHIVAYDSSGTQVDDFGEGLFAAPPFEALSAGQIAVNATTRKVYVADSGAKRVWIFDRVASILAPTATTDAASPVGQIEANINATVNPRGHGLTSCAFKYVGDADYQVNGFANATTAPCGSLPGGSLATQTSVHLNGLSPATTYDFQVAVASNGGSAEGIVRNFTTLPALPPEATTASASSISQSSATIGGTVNPKGGLISNCHFEYVGQSDFEVNGFANAKSVNCSPQKPTGTSSTSVSAKASGLIAASGYRFRVVATNNAGTATAGDQSFTTLADTCETKPELCPPPPQEPTPTTPAPQASPPSSTPPPSPAPRRLKCRKGFKKKRVHGKLKCVKIKKARKRRT